MMARSGFFLEDGKVKKGSCSWVKLVTDFYVEASS